VGYLPFQKSYFEYISIFKASNNNMEIPTSLLIASAMDMEENGNLKEW
jgi:hypothetical protein